jgi:protocatechuate 3,4-dioxygenase beta subunit
MTEGCRPWVDQELGPYHRDLDSIRHDIVQGRAGVPLQLGIRLVDRDGVTPVTGAVVEIWQCDALGRYSGFPPPNVEPADTAPSVPPEELRGEDEFLRGRQTTDGAGSCGFRTIYPGWYPGRTVHIHVAARVGDETFVSQLYFPDEVTDAVFARAPYRERPGRDTTNATDSIFAGGGEGALLDVQPDRDGLRASICFALLGPGSVQFRLGDSTMPLVPPHGGTQTRME